jgi:hypothetical protein
MLNFLGKRILQLMQWGAPFFSPPPCGEGVGVGVPQAQNPVGPPPTPTLPRMGGGRRKPC